LNNVNVVANDNDVVTLPGAESDSGFGQLRYVCNTDAAQILDIYPGTGQDLGKGTNTQMNLTAGDCTTCYTISSTAWSCTTATPE
jgi:hypothetical protein